MKKAGFILIIFGVVVALMRLIGIGMAYSLVSGSSYDPAGDILLGIATGGIFAAAGAVLIVMGNIRLRGGGYAKSLKESRAGAASNDKFYIPGSNNEKHEFFTYKGKEYDRTKYFKSRKYNFYYLYSEKSDADPMSLALKRRASLEKYNARHTNDVLSAIELEALNAYIDSLNQG